MAQRKPNILWMRGNGLYGVQDLVTTNDGLVVAASNNEIFVYRLSDMLLLRTFPVCESTAQINSIAITGFAPNRMLAVATTASTYPLRVFQLESGDLVWETNAGGAPQVVKFSPTGDHLGCSMVTTTPSYYNIFIFDTSHRNATDGAVTCTKYLCQWFDWWPISTAAAQDIFFGGGFTDAAYPKYLVDQEFYADGSGTGTAPWVDAGSFVYTAWGLVASGTMAGPAIVGYGTLDDGTTNSYPSGYGLFFGGNLGNIFDTFPMENDLLVHPSTSSLYYVGAKQKFTQLSGLNSDYYLILAGIDHGQGNKPLVDIITNTAAGPFVRLQYLAGIEPNLHAATNGLNSSEPFNISDDYSKIVLETAVNAPGPAERGYDIGVYNLSGATLATSAGGHDGSVTDVAFGATGSFVASAGADGWVRLWDRTGKLLSQFEPAVVGVSQMMIAVSRNAKYLAVASNGSYGSLLYDVSNPKAPQFIKQVGGGVPVACIRFSPDSTRIYQGGGLDNGIGVFDLATGTRLLTIPDTNPFDITADGTRIVTQVGVYDALTGVNPIVFPQFSPPNYASVVAVSPGGTSAAVMNTAGLRLISWATGRVSAAPILPRVDWFSWRTALKFSPDGRFLYASNGGDGKVYVFDARTTVEVAAYSQETGQASVYGAYKGASSFGFSPDNTQWAYGRWDSPVVVAENDFFAPPALGGIKLSAASAIGGVSIKALVSMAVPGVASQTVNLSSDKPTVASVPVSVSVPGGTFTATAPVRTLPVDSSTVVTVTAKYGGTSFGAAIAVQPPPLSSVTLYPTTVVGGAPVGLTVRIGGKAGPSGVVVALSYAGPVSGPGSVYIPTGGTYASCKVSTTKVNTAAVGTVTATRSGLDKSSSLTVEP